MGDTRIQVKVCGLTRQEDVHICQDLGVDLLGFIFHPASPRCLNPEAVPLSIPGRARRVGVFVRHSLDQVRTIMDLAGLDLAQLHGKQDVDFCRRVGAERVIKVLWPQSYAHAQAMQEDLQRFAPVCSMFLVDSGYQGGGHGATCRVSWLQDLSFPRPWYLAGGLSPKTLPEMLQTLPLQGVDLNSGVESTSGIKDEGKIQACMQTIRTSNSIKGDFP